MSCNYQFKGEMYTEDQLIEVLARDSKIIDKYRSQEERLTSDDFAKEDLATFEEKVAALKQTMNVEVIMDETVETSRVLGRGDKRVKEAGKPVILINPNAIFKTTAIHEFGHIFIDAFPKGINNPRIQRALKELEGTELAAQVSEAYSDLSPEMLQKEILVTAIGQKGSELWDAGKKSKWETFMAWFSDFIKRTFGLERSEVEALSRDLLSNKVKQIGITRLDKIAQEQKEVKIEENKTKTEKEFDKVVNSIENTHARVLGTAKKLLARQKDKQESKEARIRENKNIKKGKTTRLSSITELQEALTKYEDADKMLGIVKYTEWAAKELSFMKSEIERRKKENKVTSNNLDKSFDWSKSFRTAEDIQNLLAETSDEDLLEYMTEEKLDSLKAMVRYISSARDEVQADLLNLARIEYAKILADNDVQTEERYKNEYREEWEALNEAGGTSLQKGEYLIQKMQENKDEIEEEKLLIAEERARRGQGQLSMVSMQILSEKQMKSRDIQAVSSMLDEASSRYEKFATEEATDVLSDFNKFQDSGATNVKSRDMRKRYKGMYVFSESGQGYFTSEYSPEFLEEKNKIQSRMFEKESYDELFENTEIRIVTGKRKDETGDLISTKNYEYDSQIISTETGKPVKGLLKFSGSKNINLEGEESLKNGERATHVLYENSAGKEVRITLNEAIARSEYAAWEKTNTVTKTTMEYGMKTKSVTPVDKWKSKEWEELKKDPVRFKELEKLKERVVQGNIDYDNRDSLVSKEGTVDFIRLPGVMKSTVSRAVQKQSAKTLGEHLLSTMIETQADDFDTQSMKSYAVQKQSAKRLDDKTQANDSDVQSTKSYTNFSEGETLRIPIPYRAQLNESDQSLDLHQLVTMDRIMAKNYKEKKSIESSLKVIQEVLKEKRFPVLDPVTSRQKVDAQSLDLLWKTNKNSTIQEYEKIQSIIENRLYGITSKQAGGFQVTKNKGKENEKNYTVEYQKLGQTLTKYFGSVSLVFNYMNSIVNAGTGTLSNLIEAVGGDVYNLKDYKKAQDEYNKDLRNIISDWGSPVATSKTNLLLNAFNVMGPGYIQKNFEKSGKAEAMLSQSTLRPIAKMGEHMMQSKVMYAILNSIKVQNNKGQWIGKDGKKVSSKKQAASMSDMISFKKNVNGKIEMDLHESVENTSFTTGGKNQILLETRNLIRAKVDELHGQYTSDIQAHAQRNMIGKLGFFLRKWMIPGYLRRFRGVNNSLKASNTELAEADEFFSADQKDNIEGYYVTAVRFLSQIVKDAKEDSINITKSWKKLTPKQQSGVRKSLIDLSLIAIVYALSTGLDSEDEDDEMIHLRYLVRRQLSELANFVNPAEAFKIAQTPTAATGNLKQIMKTAIQLFNPTEEYQIGRYKGDLKLKHKAKKLLPRFKNEEDFKQALEFLNNMSM